MCPSTNHPAGHTETASAVPGSLTSSPVVDAHHHLWRYTASQFPWIDDRMAALQRDFSPADLMHAMQSAAVDRTVAVQARQSHEETATLLHAAAAHPQIAAVVGWLPLADRPALEKSLTLHGSHPLLAGARHVVQDEPPGFLHDPAFNVGVDLLTQADLAYDLLLRADQLEEAAIFVDRHPNQRFVLDHMAKPRIAAGVLHPWKTHLTRLAARPNLSCKVSGLVTEAHWNCWSPQNLKPYLDAAVDAFGTDRLMAGSDWPVCLLSSTYAHWWTTLRIYFAAFSREQQTAIFGGNATSFYRLQPSTVGVKEGHQRHADL